MDYGVATSTWNSQRGPAYELAALSSLNECWAHSSACCWSCYTTGSGALSLPSLFTSPPHCVSSFPPAVLSLSNHVLFFDSLGIETDVHLPTVFSVSQRCRRKTKVSCLSPQSARGGLNRPFLLCWPHSWRLPRLAGSFSQWEFHFALEVG